MSHIATTHHLERAAVTARHGKSGLLDCSIYPPQQQQRLHSLTRMLPLPRFSAISPHSHIKGTTAAACGLATDAAAANTQHAAAAAATGCPCDTVRVCCPPPRPHPWCVDVPDALVCLHHALGGVQVIIAAHVGGVQVAHVVQSVTHQGGSIKQLGGGRGREEVSTDRVYSSRKKGGHDHVG